MNFLKITKNTADYFSKKVTSHKDTPLGVDWNSSYAQETRQDQVLKVLKTKRNFSINDIGCGYAHLFDHLKLNNYSDFLYQGSDISSKMIEQAEKKHGNSNIKLQLINSISEINIADYSVASGVFNMKGDVDNEKWQAYVIQSLIQINAKSKNGFSFNMLTSYSDKKYTRSDLYYGDPLLYFDFCKKNFSENIVLLHDYGLFDFTILVRK
jgi:SAM-dependent methyltransferase